MLFVSTATLGQAAPVSEPQLRMSLDSSTNAERAFGASLFLHVQGTAEDGFEVKVVAPRRIRGCYPNLVHWAPHGPDPSDVMPWHVAQRYYPNTRVIPVCGHKLAVEITLASPVVSPNATRFTSGMLVVTVKHAKWVSDAGISQFFQTDASSPRD